MTDGSCLTCAEGSLYRVRNLDNVPMLASGIVIVDVSDVFSPPVCWITVKCPLGYVPLLAAYMTYYVCQIICPLPLHPRCG